MTDPEPWSSELGDLPWRCGWPGPLGRVAASSGISKAELAEDMGAARAGSERDAILEYLARRFAEGELKTWWDRWTPGGHEAEDLGPTEKVEAAAGEARQVLLKPTRVLGDPTGSSDVTVEVREIHEDDSGWRTRYSCLVGRDRYSFRSARWRLLFEPQDLDRCLRRRRSTDATLPHQRHLGLARILFGEIAWQDLLDCLVPHRTGSFDADAQLLTRTVDGRLPGDVIGYELRVALDSDA